MITDKLTGLWGRRFFDDALAGAIERSERYGTNVGLVMLDLDNFAEVNRRYRHAQGDVVLREVARVLLEEREGHHSARYGGDEFAVVLPGANRDDTFSFAERVCKSIAALRIPRLDGEGDLAVTASLGVATVPPVAADAEDLVAVADKALYEAKRKRRN